MIARLPSLIAILFVTTLTGCFPEAQQNNTEVDAWKRTLPEPNADYGSYPENYQEIIKNYLAKTLKDPDSAKYSDFTKPRKEHAIENIDLKKAVYGYSSCVLVNAKNSYGGYTGNHLFWFFIRNGVVVRESDTTVGINHTYIGHPINCQNG